MVIATIQNLRRAPGFASWWGLVEPKLGSDPVYGFFKDMRDDIEHEGVFEVWTAPGVITSLEPTTSQWAHLAPPDTDQTSIRLDGHVEFRGPYGVHLVPLPDHLVTRTLTFMHPPLGHEHEDAGTTARAYHSLLRSAVLETRAWFGHMP